MTAPSLRPRGLQFRIVVLFLGLLLVVQAAGLALVTSRIDASARAAVAHELDTDRRVLQRLLRQSAAHLTDAARLLAADYAFREAVSLDDADTLASALENHGARVGAAVALLVDTQFRLKAATVPGAERFLPQLQRLSGAPEGEQLVLIDGRPYQLVAAPVYAPLTVGWVAMAFAVQTPLLRDIAAVSGIDIAVFARGGADAPWQPVASTLPDGEAADLDARWPAQAAVSDPLLQLGAGTAARDVLAHAVPLVSDGDTEARAVLLRAIAPAMAPYRKLQWLLFSVTLAAVVLFALGSVATARRITTPLRALGAAARRLRAGDYAAPVALPPRDDELGELAESFESMRLAVHERDAELRRVAYEDALTGLPNRARFRDAARDAVAAGPPCALLTLDLDRFKQVNDVLGQAFGDRLLAEFARRLRDAAPRGEQDLVARLAGDKFALLLPGADAAGAQAAADRIQAALQQPIALENQTVDLGAGIGIACAPEHGDDADLLLARAEAAMVAAKRRQAGVLAYAPSFDHASAESLSLLGELRRAVERDELQLWLQPKVALASGEVVGAEALVRWQHPERGLIPPLRFIPFAEQTGFIRDVTRWVLEQGSRSLRDLHTVNGKLRLAVNMSVRDLLDQDLPRKLSALAQANATAPVTLCLEITESAMMEDPQRAQQTLQALHEMGFKLSIDDFGTGYSSLAYLRRLPVDELKIDRSFVGGMEHDLDDAKIVRSVIDLAHNLQLKVVAEGVETPTTWKLLQALRCDEAQGFLIAKPMPAHEFAAWLPRWRAPQVQSLPLQSAFARLL